MLSSGQTIASRRRYVAIVSLHGTALNDTSYLSAGNASNQLAVLAIWSGDSFSSVYYCYRALCVKEPFPTAPDNLAKTLHKAVDQRRKGLGGVIETASDAFRAEIVYLHGLWHLKPG